MSDHTKYIVPATLIGMALTPLAFWYFNPFVLMSTNKDKTKNRRINGE